jgi:paraquat-inducible protein B
MSPKEKDPTAPSDLPKAWVGMRRRFPFIWIVPLVAAMVAAWLVFDRVRREGPLVTIVFADGRGVSAGQTVLKYRGVPVGTVKAAHLSADAKRVVVKARLDRSATTLARQGSIFWIVRPEVGAGGIGGLETIVSGPYIQVQPGQGGEQTEFIGAEDAPVLKPEQGGLEILLLTPHKSSLTEESPVYYRGMEVGTLRYFELNKDGSAVIVHALVENRFAALVRTNTKFWNAGGINVSLKLFGINMSAESVKSLVIGGVEFATPEPPGPPCPSNNTFVLYDKPDEKWLKRSSAIPELQNTNTSEHAAPPPIPSGIKSLSQ